MDVFIIVVHYWFADTKEDYENFGFTTDENEIDQMVNHVFENESEIDWVGYQHWRDKTNLIETKIIREKSRD